MKLINKIEFFIIISSIVLFTLLGCSQLTIDVPEPPEPPELIINDDVIVIDPTITLISDSTELSQGIYHYQYTGTPPDFTTNSVIVGQQGYGYMRNVNNVTQSGDEIILETEQAYLADVIDQCDIQDAITLSFSEKYIDMRVVYLAEGVSINRTSNGIGIISLSDTILYSDDNLTAKITNGSINFEPILNIELKIESISPFVRKFRLSAGGIIDFDCDLQLNCSVPISVGDKIPIVPIGVFEFGPILIGPVPMYVGFSLYAGFDAGLNITGTFETGFDTYASVEFGAKYHYIDKWSTIWEKSAYFNQHPLVWDYSGNIYARAYVSPELNVTLGGFVGPTFGVEPYLEFDGSIENNNWQWELNGGLDGNLEI